MPFGRGSAARDYARAVAPPRAVDESPGSPIEVDLKAHKRVDRTHSDFKTIQSTLTTFQITKVECLVSTANFIANKSEIHRSITIKTVFVLTNLHSDGSEYQRN